MDPVKGLMKSLKDLVTSDKQVKLDFKCILYRLRRRTFITRLLNLSGLWIRLKTKSSSSRQSRTSTCSATYRVKKVTRVMAGDVKVVLESFTIQAVANMKEVLGEEEN